MWRYGSEIKVIECDDKVRETYYYNGIFLNSLMVEDGQILILFLNI